MKTKLFLLMAVMSVRLSYAQTNSVSSGNWSETTVWSTGVVPGAATNVNVNNPIVLDQNLTLGTGDYIFFQNVTDLPGGSSYSINAATAGGVLDIRSGTTTLNGNASFANATLIVRSGATLILGSTTLNNNNAITVEAGGTLIINGTFTNSNSGGSFTLNGMVYVNGNYTTNNGNIDIGGTGDIITSGTIDTQGSSDVFGNTTDCETGPCSGRNLCDYGGERNTISPSAAQVLCSSSTPVTLDGSTISDGAGNPPPPVYTWQSSTTSATSGFSTVATTENYSPPATVGTTWYRRTVSYDGCTGTTPAVEIRVLGSGGWIGATSTSWTTASNWCSNQVPTATTDVTITTGVARQPVVNAAAVCKDLTIHAGASVTVNSSLSISGNMLNSGTFTTSSGSTVSLAGTTQQTISSALVDFHNLVINNAAGVIQNGFFNVSNALTMTAGKVNLSGYNLTLGSGAGSTGTLNYTAGGFINGDFTRWMPASTIADGSTAGLFPMATTVDSRPFYVSYPSSAPNPAGKLRVSHTGAATVTTGLAVTDGANSIQRRQDSYWRVSSTVLSGGTYNVRAGGTGFGTVQEVADLRIMLASGIVGTSSTNGGSPTDPRVNRTGLTLANLNNTFYIGSVDPTNTTLPIELLSFAGEPEAGGVQLRWTTASEINFDHFSIEHSQDGIGFSEISRVDGSGDEKSRTDYTFLHQTPASGKNYYRLRSVDLDGSFAYSKVVMVQYEGGKRLTVFPNPSAPTHIQFQSNFEIAENDRITVVNQLGMQVAYGVADIDGQVINFSNTLHPGIYLLQYVGRDYKSVVRITVK